MYKSSDKKMLILL